MKNKLLIFLLIYGIKFHAQSSQAASVQGSKNSDSTFKIFPNPFNAQLTIETENAIGKCVYVCDTFGVVRKKVRIHGKQTKVNLSALPKGTYLVELGKQRRKFQKE